MTTYTVPKCIMGWRFTFNVDVHVATLGKKFLSVQLGSNTTTPKTNRPNVPTLSSWLDPFQIYTIKTLHWGVNLFSETGAFSIVPKYKKYWMAVLNVIMLIPNLGKKWMDGFPGVQSATPTINWPNILTEQIYQLCWCYWRIVESM